MAGGDSRAVEGGAITVPLRLVRDVVRISTAGFSGFFKKDCADLSRRISLLAHLLEEIRDSKKLHANGEVGSSSSRISCLSELTMVLQAAKRLVVSANNFDECKTASDGATKKILFQFQCVTWKLEKALTNLPYNDFDISEEIQEQVELVRSQLKRATERYGGSLNSSLLYRTSSQPLDKEIDPYKQSKRSIQSLHVENIGNVDHESRPKLKDLLEGNRSETNEFFQNKASLKESSVRIVPNEIEKSTCKDLEENKKLNSPIIPDDYLCPISLELMRDPVIVATGQTYERSYIQRWIDGGNMTCPKTQQKLQHLTLTPNYVLRSLISQWCVKNNTEQPTSLMGGKIKKGDGSFRDVTDDIAAIESLVRKLSSRSIDDRRAAVAEIRSLSKRSTDNRILLAEAGAIPILVHLLTSEDTQIQENAVTSVLNLSIFDNNKGLIMLANAIPSIVQVLRAGSMEAKENAAATLFSLSLADENKIIIGASGAIPALVDLLESGSPRGKKDAATALFNLCIYHGNKGRAVRAGIVAALIKILTDSSMVDEALTILSVLSGNLEAKFAIVKAGTIPVLVNLLRIGSNRTKENASAILLSLCKRDNQNLTCLRRLGAEVVLAEVAKNGTERAKRKATALLGHIGNLPKVV